MLRFRVVKDSGKAAARRLAPALLLIVLVAGQGLALDLDARRMATGGAVPPLASRLGGENPAYSVVPDRYPDGGFNIPLPLGLPTLVDVLSHMDPESEDFDPVAVINLMANPPFHMELTEPSPLDGDILIDLGLDHFRLFWEDAALFLPQEPLDFGLRMERFSLGLGQTIDERWRWRAQVAPFVDGAARAELDDALYGVLAEGDSVLGNSRYGLNAELDLAGGVAWKLLLAGLVNPYGDTEIYLAVAPKVITGFGMLSSDLALSAETGDTLFASEDFAVDQVSYERYTDGFALGHGFALDAGLVLRRGPWDFGVGVRDLAGSITFASTTLERRRLVDPAEEGRDVEGELVSEILESGVSHTYRFTPFWTLNAAYSRETWLLMGELRLRPWRNTLHLGSEYYLGRLTLRGGLRKDFRDRWQVSGGLGVRTGPLELNIALETHNRYIQDERGVALGLGLTI